MEYNNILHCGKEININNISVFGSGDIINFSWSEIKIKDDNLTFGDYSDLFIETPLVKVRNCNKSEYNYKQYFIDICFPDINVRDNKKYQNFITLLNQMNDKVEMLVEYFLEDYDSNIIINKHKSPLCNTSNSMRLYIENIDHFPLFYYSDNSVISKREFLQSSFMEDLQNIKIKCIFQPLVWIKPGNNNFQYGIKYFIKQCIFSLNKPINEKILCSKKMLSIDDNNNQLCSICQEELIKCGDNYSSSITELPCHHKYHFKCINNWYNIQISNHRNFSCPECRQV